VTAVELDNHKSALEHKALVEKELRQQIAEGNYVLAATKPSIVSPLAAIPKDENSIRVIHDGSRPFGYAMNSYATLRSERFQTIDDACKLAKPNYWCAKLDLKSAYRSVPIHKDDYKVTGLKWQFAEDLEPTYLFDSRLPFGSTLAPSHFHRLSQAIGRCLRRHGWSDVVVYIDDFLIVAPTYEQCNQALHCLIRLVRRLGFYVSWNKVVGPTQRITFLGIEIDTRSCSLSLGEDKLQTIQQQLLDFSVKKRASKRQLQRLAGLLNWACQAVRGGRFFLRRLLDTIAPLQQQHHKVKLTIDFKKDIEWWLSFLFTFNGTVYYNKGETHHVHVDACKKACGAFWRGDFQYVVFHKDQKAASQLHINYKEVCAVVNAVEKWAPDWAHSVVVVHTDSTVAKAVINKGRSKNRYINMLLRKMFWLSERYDFKVRAIHVPGAVNLFPDTISRLHEAGKSETLCRMLSNWFHASVVCVNWLNHMSQDAFYFLVQEQLKRLKRNCWKSSLCSVALPSLIIQQKPIGLT
jgi:hypothetical protein